MSKIKDGQSAQDWISMMKSYEGAVLMGHQLPDHDAVGGMAGMAALARGAGIPVSIAPGLPAEGLQSAIDSLAAEEIPIISSPPENLAHCVIIVADTQRSTFAAYPEWLPNAGGIAVIDHHLAGQGSIEDRVLSWIDPASSSTSELAACLLYDAGINPTIKQADLMLAGITLDTHRFLVRVSERTFRQAAHLCGWGARVERIRTFFEDRIESFIARSQAIHNAKIEDGMAFSVLSVDIEGIRVIAAQAADDLIFLQGIQGAFVACADRGTTAVSVRAREGLSAVQWVSSLGGGGSHVSAGIQFEGITPCQAIERIREAVKETVKESVKESVKDSVKEPVKEPVKESVKGSVKEPV